MSITAFLQGGMANQCLIASAALSAAQRIGTDLRFNTSSYHSDPMRQFSMGLWQGFQDVPVSTYPPQEPIVREQGLPYSRELHDSITDGCTMIGFFQTETYFKDIKPFLKQKFVPAKPLSNGSKQTLHMIESAGPRSTFLTIRRTDYLNSDFHGILPLSYYLAALRIVAQKVDPLVFVFSDEPEWCEENLKLPYPMFISGNFDRTTKTHLGREDSELWLMRHCHNAVMANSSYSFFGAWLGADDLGGVVTYPTRWFQNANEDARDICPKRWQAVTT